MENSDNRVMDTSENSLIMKIRQNAYERYFY